MESCLIIHLWAMHENIRKTIKACINIATRAVLIHTMIGKKHMFVDLLKNVYRRMCEQLTSYVNVLEGWKIFANVY